MGMADSEQPVAAQVAPQSKAMSCLERPSFLEACRMVERPYSCLVRVTHRRHLALPPRFLHKKRSGLHEQLGGELLRYSSRLEGVPLAYDNLKIVGELGDIHDDVGYIHLNIQADFVIFQPQRGQRLVGLVNKVAPSHIGCLVHDCFNASIPKPMKMPIEVWQHIGVKIGDQMEFEVSQLDSDAVGVSCIRGWLDKKLEAGAFERLKDVAKENDPMSTDNTARADENADEEEDNKTIEIPEDSRLRKTKKGHTQKTLPENVTGTSEDCNTSLEEIPKKKRKKKHQELCSQTDTVEVDASIESSSVASAILNSSSLSADDVCKKPREKKKPKHSLPCIDADGNIEVEESNLSSFENESLLPVSLERPKKYKKKKLKDRSDVWLDHSLQNVILEDSVLTENSVMEDFGANPETVPENTPKKHKKKHKRHSEVPDPPLEFTNGEADFIAEESQDILKQESAKHKKHKKKRHYVLTESDNGAAQTVDSTISARQEFVEPKAKKKRK